ncbi:hypothetical protein PTNB73_07593 [Pyrenophora teres f. teres]|uniref:Uncharacterized protein n=1 Tax=Pyrenophora teres f. teres TaxID=97479 RepID=A0A6S6WDG0_9PLEO|nr:hypothetical protein PTNB85_09284 [Pyrenophora teres f. teres]KAE8858122.1 hypothetical protein PTNB29_07337 [Pyrenophora teres f. teres]KAE8862039.1 hypothetical protein PTNB73_07593 [Pyrenophora teres f. teres]CAE7208249.1 hypothetical protein PTTW11_09805 [Pyrenophora teres f. teres]
MCWSFNLGLPGKKKPKASPSSEKKRRGRPSDGALGGEGRAVAEDVSEKRSSKHSSSKRRSADSTPHSPPSQRREREREEPRPRSQLPYEDAYRSRERYRPAQHMQVPQTYHRSAEPATVNSSQETLLNPRPHRSQHHRRHHPNQTSQSTLRGRGAKRDPPRHSKSKKNIRPEPSRGWSLFAPSPPKTPKRVSRSYNTLDASPRSHRSSRQPHSASPSQPSPDSTPSHTRHPHHRSRQHQPSAPSARQARSRTPNTTARRVPDRRFAVLAATNQALEEVRQEAFAAPSPPPRRERLRRYEGIAIPTSQIPFNWDCVSSSQTSAGHGDRNGESSTRQRRSRR